MLKNIETYIKELSNIYDVDYFKIYRELIDKFYTDSDYSIYRINFVFYDKFKIEPLNYEPTQKLCEARIGQTKFRKDLINFYENCIITKDDFEICQACHIISYSEKKINSVENGLLLNYNFHHMFDSFLITFEYVENYNMIFDYYKVIFSEKIKNKHSFKNYFIYENTLVKININSKEFINTKYKEFIDINNKSNSI